MWNKLNFYINSLINQEIYKGTINKIRRNDGNYEYKHKKLINKLPRSKEVLISERMDKSENKILAAWMNIWMKEWISEFMRGWINDLMDEWVNGWMS